MPEEQTAQLDDPSKAPVEESPEQDSKAHEAERKDSTTASIKRWTKRIRDARNRFKDDFDRMRDDMNFHANIQWKGQKTAQYEKYIANLTNRAVNQKVAILYARDPRVVARRRKRLDYSVWDEKLESLGSAVQRQTAIQLLQATGDPIPPDIESMAIIADYQRGRMQRELVDRVGRTMETLWQYEIDTQEPDFKTQMKQLVRRVVVTGVGYVRVNFERMNPSHPDTSSTRSDIVERAKKVKLLMQKLEDDKIQPSDADAEQLRLLMSSLGAPTPLEQSEQLNERLTFDFIPPTSLIPDPACRNLKGFVGARWLAHEFILPLDYVNAFFETEIKIGGGSESGVKQYNDKGQELTPSASAEGEKEDPLCKPKVCLWCVLNLDDKTQFFIVDGYNKYAMEPERLTPEIRGFWPIFALTFNDVEVVEGTKASVFPPSDVTLMRHAQKEWNRTRNDLRDQRKASAPVYVTGKGWLTEEDLANIVNANPNSVVQLEGANRGEDITKLLTRLPVAPIDPSMYDTRPLEDDILRSAGLQDANLGPAKPNVTATVGNIAEQSRMSMASSNIDDLDDFLSMLARASGEMMLQEFSPTTVVRKCGPGSVWPSEGDRADFLNRIYLEIQAASSGRPNKAVEISNAQMLGPLLLQAGANPMFLVREFVKRLDDRLDPEEAFPLVPTHPATPGGMAIGNMMALGNQGQEQKTPDGSPVPNPANQGK